MEPHLLRLLGRLGIHFEPLGELVEFHGRRQPCMTHLEPMLERVLAERPDIWSVIAAPKA
jgi:N-acyl amino acid synthase of PEP-CTERM/exosortase system